MTKSALDFCELKLLEGELSQRKNAIEELLTEAYFPPYWDELIERTMANNSDLALFITSGINDIDTSNLDDFQISELKIILEFIYHHQSDGYKKAIRDEFRAFADSKTSMERFYKKYNKTQKKNNHYEEYAMTEKILFARVADYLDKQIDD